MVRQYNETQRIFFVVFRSLEIGDYSDLSTFLWISRVNKREKKKKTQSKRPERKKKGRLENERNMITWIYKYTKPIFGKAFRFLFQVVRISRWTMPYNGFIMTPSCEEIYFLIRRIREATETKTEDIYFCLNSLSCLWSRNVATDFRHEEEKHCRINPFSLAIVVFSVIYIAIGTCNDFCNF